MIKQKRNHMAPLIIGNRPALSGAECTFIKMDNGKGLKLYYEEYLARKTYEMQAHAASYGLAPHVGPFIFKFNKNAHIYHAYYTECIKKTLYDRYQHVGVWWDDVAWPKHKDWGDRCCIDGPSIGLPDIAQQLADIGIKPYDLNYGNVGWMDDGRFVCIDFGLCDWA